MTGINLKKIFKLDIISIFSRNDWIIGCLYDSRDFSNIELQNQSSVSEGRHEFVQNHQLNRKNKKLKIFAMWMIGFIFTVHRIVKRASTVPRFFLKIDPECICIQVWTERYICKESWTESDSFTRHRKLRTFSFLVHRLAGNNYCFQEMESLHENKHSQSNRYFFYF